MNRRLSNHSLRRLGAAATSDPSTRRSGERDHVCFEHGMPVARDPERLLPPRSTVHHYLDLWSYDGTLDRIHHALYECRERGTREASPTAAIIDSQSVKSAGKGPVSTRMAMMRARVRVEGACYLWRKIISLLSPPTGELPSSAQTATQRRARRAFRNRTNSSSIKRMPRLLKPSRT